MNCCTDTTRKQSRSTHIVYVYVGYVYKLLEITKENLPERESRLESGGLAVQYRDLLWHSLL